MTERSHITILRELLSDPSIADISLILDAGSGKTSLSTIISCFPKASVDAIVYPGDERKLKTIRNMQSDKVNVVEYRVLNGSGVAAQRRRFHCSIPPVAVLVLGRNIQCLLLAGNCVFPGRFSRPNCSNRVLVHGERVIEQKIHVSGF